MLIDDEGLSIQIDGQIIGAGRNLETVGGAKVAQLNINAKQVLGQQETILGRTETIG